MKKYVIYHKADFDGIFCREIAQKRFGNAADYIGWDYGDPIPAIPEGSELFMLDISVDGLMDFPELVWIDHHKTAIEKFGDKIAGLRMDGVAACRLAWQYWFSVDHHIGRELTKSDYINRIVTEPLAVRLAGEYDIWDKRDPDADLFQHGLRGVNLDELWPFLLSLIRDNEKYVHQILDGGRAIQYAKNRENESIINASGFTVEFEGLRFLACNHARYNSHLFSAGLKEDHDGCLGFNWDGSMWRVSLYHAPGKEHHDLSVIASKHGGGGHRGACGFKATALPFLKL